MKLLVGESYSGCLACRHLVWVDVDGYVRCIKGHGGRVKRYCIDFAPR